MDAMDSFSRCLDLSRDDPLDYSYVNEEDSQILNLSLGLLLSSPKNPNDNSPLNLTGRSNTRYLSFLHPEFSKPKDDTTIVEGTNVDSYMSFNPQRQNVQVFEAPDFLGMNELQDLRLNANSSPYYIYDMIKTSEPDIWQYDQPKNYSLEILQKIQTQQGSKEFDEAYRNVVKNEQEKEKRAKLAKMERKQLEKPEPFSLDYSFPFEPLELKVTRTAGDKAQMKTGPKSDHSNLMEGVYDLSSQRLVKSFDEDSIGFSTGLFSCDFLSCDKPVNMSPVKRNLTKMTCLKPSEISRQMVFEPSKSQAPGCSKVVESVPSSSVINEKVNVLENELVFCNSSFVASYRPTANTPSAVDKTENYSHKKHGSYQNKCRSYSKQTKSVSNTSSAISSGPKCTLMSPNRMEIDDYLKEKGASNPKDDKSLDSIVLFKGGETLERLYPGSCAASTTTSSGLHISPCNTLTDPNRLEIDSYLKKKEAPRPNDNKTLDSKVMFEESETLGRINPVERMILDSNVISSAKKNNLHTSSSSTLTCPIGLEIHGYLGGKEASQSSVDKSVGLFKNDEVVGRLCPQETMILDSSHNFSKHDVGILTTGDLTSLQAPLPPSLMDVYRMPVASNTLKCQRRLETDRYLNEKQAPQSNKDKSLDSRRLGVTVGRVCPEDIMILDPKKGSNRDQLPVASNSLKCQSRLETERYLNGKQVPQSDKDKSLGSRRIGVTVGRVYPEDGIILDPKKSSNRDQLPVARKSLPSIDGSKRERHPLSLMMPVSEVASDYILLKSPCEGSFATSSDLKVLTGGIRVSPEKEEFKPQFFLTDTPAKFQEFVFSVDIPEKNVATRAEVPLFKGTKTNSKKQSKRLGIGKRERIRVRPGGKKSPVGKESKKESMALEDNLEDFANWRFLCPICLNGFNEAEDHRNHMDGHKEMKPFKCDYCGDRFPRKHALLMHIVRHEQQKPASRFQCSTCQKAFVKKKRFEEHEKMHSNI